jgi:hypothetical protein
MQKKAFPAQVTQGPIQTGMDLREFFAAYAMQALISQRGYSPETKEEIALVSFEMADAMMKVRNENRFGF